jgi:predicted phage terminase large subunit-like protein
LKRSNASLAGLLDLRRLRAEKARRHLREFVVQAWHVLEPDRPFVPNWHIDAVCEHLEAVGRGQLRKLVINIPPGHMKSLLVSVFWPAWMWLHKPSWQSVFSSYAEDLVIRDSARTRAVLESEWFQEMFAPEWEFRHDENRLDVFKNSAMGHRQCVTVGGRATGFRGDVVVCDDPINAVDVYSKAAREKVIRWWSKTMSSRLNDKRTGGRVLIMQRLHEDDLAGHLIAAGGWETLVLPSEFDSKRRARTTIGFVDPREKDGELLFPVMFPREVLEEAKIDLGSDGYAGQHSQLPSPAEGAMLKRAWFQRRWRRRGEPDVEGLETRMLPDKFDRVIMVLDASFKKTDAADRVALGVVGKLGPDRYLLDLTWGQMSFTETLRAFVDMAAAWPSAREKIVEDKANGTAVIDVLRKKLSGIIAVQPIGGKDTRIAAVSPEIEAGNVWLPAFAPWVSSFIEECIAFPKATHDDAPDMLAHALLRLSDSSDLERLRKLVRY